MPIIATTYAGMILWEQNIYVRVRSDYCALISFNFCHCRMAHIAPDSKHSLIYSDAMKYFSDI